jgi:putative dimethyl sulfoxide reductase chaperone
MIVIDSAIQRSQVYCFLAHAFLYPHENWLEDLPAIMAIMEGIDLTRQLDAFPAAETCDLESLQSYHRQAFGVTGSLLYETEMGLPHEFRQSQELADISGFYRAFGFETGGEVRERPDFLATELEFMYVLTLKEAYAGSQGQEEAIQLCRDAQRMFLADHLGKWVGVFADALEKAAIERLLPVSANSPYGPLARLAQRFIEAECTSLGITPARLKPQELRPTPFDPDFSCQTCPASELQS